MKKQFQSKSVPRGTRTIWRYLGALFILFTFAIGNVWAESVTFTATDMSGKTSGVKKESHITALCPTSESDQQAYKPKSAVKYKAISLGSSADTAVIVPASGKSLHFRADAGYKITGISIFAAANKDSICGEPIVMWTGAISKKPAFVGNIEAPSRAGTSDPDPIVVANIPDGTTAFALYRRIKYNSTTGEIGSGSNFGRSEQTWNIFSVTITYEATTPATKHTVTYKLNGATGTTPTQADVAEGAKFTLHNGTNGITAPTNKDFDGWHDGTTKYAGGAEYTMGTSDVELTAQWKDHVAKYTLVYRVDGVAVGNEQVNVSGTPAGLASDPTKDCYTFAGWSPALSSVSGTDGATVYVDATWTGNYFTTSVDFENGDESTVSGIASKNIVASNAGSYDGGKASENWAYKGWKIKSNGATVKVLVQANKKLTYKFGYLDATAHVNITNDNITREVTGASKEEGNSLKYTIYSHIKDYDAVYTFTTGSSGAAVIKALSVEAVYTAYFEDEMGVVTTTVVGNVTEVELPTPSVTTKSGKNFIGWKANKAVTVDDEVVNANTLIAAGKIAVLSDNTTFTTQWVAPANFDVKFYQGYGEPDVQIGETQSISTGNFAVVPAEDPTRTGFVFLGWSYDATEAHIVNVAAYGITAATDFTAMWKAVWTVTFDGAGAVNVEDGETVASPDSPTQAGKVFQGWYNGESKYDFSAAVTGNLALESKWADADPNHYVYAYNDDFHFDGVVYKTPEGKTTDPEAVEATLNLTTPYTLFSGAKGITSIVATKAVYDYKKGDNTKHITAYLKLKKSSDDANSKLIFTIASGYTAVLKVKMGGYSKTPTVTLKKGDDVVTGTPATVSGKAEDKDYAEITYNLVAGIYEMTTADQTLYFSHIDLQATPLPTFTVTYVPGEGTGDEVVDNDATMVADCPAGFTAPTGKAFNGWKDGDNNDVEVGATVTESMTLTAQWINQYAVTFDMQGHGSAIATQYIKHGAKATKPADPYVIGWEFGGWFTESTCENEFDFNTAIEATTPLFAKWTEFTGCVEVLPAKSGEAIAVGDPIVMQEGSHGAAMTALAIPDGGALNYTNSGLAFATKTGVKANVVLSNDIVAGTKIILTLVAGGDKTRGLFIYTKDGAKINDFTCWVDGVNPASNGLEDTFTYIVQAGDGLEGTNEFQLWRNNTVYLKSLKVSSCGDAIINHNLTSAVNIAGKGTVTLGASVVREGYTTTATYSDIDPLYEFVNWTISGTGASIENATANPATITMGTEDAVVTLNLQLKPVKFTVNYYEGTTLKGTEEVTVNEYPTAAGIETAKAHYIFEGWAESPTATAADVIDLATLTSAEAATFNLYAIYTHVPCVSEGTVFSMSITDPEGTEYDGNNEFNLEIGATYVGGKAYSGSKNSTKRVGVINANGEYSFENAGDVTVKIAMDCALQEGDVITFTTSTTRELKIQKVAGTDLVTTSGKKYVIPAASPLIDVYDFYLERGNSQSTMKTFNVTRPYTVSFEMQGHGDAIEAQKLIAGDKVVEPTAPTADGWDFKGWYKEAACTNAWDFENDVVAGTMALYAKWDVHVTNDATLKSLKYGTTAIALEDGIYEYNINLPALTTAVPALDAETNSALATKLITNAAAFDGEGHATSTVKVTSEDLTVELTYTVNFAKAASVALQDVTGSITWDFNGAVTADVNINNTLTVIANYAGVSLDGADKLEVKGTKFMKSPACVRANQMHFYTTVPGKLTVEYSNTGGNAVRYLYVNGVKYDEAGTESTAKKGGDTKVFVPAGDVELVMMDGSDASKELNIYRIIFNATPDYERNVSSNYGTLCVEHNVPAGQYLGATFYQIASRNEIYSDKIDFEEVLPNEELKAGEPYLFKSNTGKIELFFSETTSNVAPKPVRGMIGNYAATTLEIDENNMSTTYYFANNKLWSCENLVGVGLTLNEHRCYINFTQVPTYEEYIALQQPNSAPRRRVSLGMNSEKIATGCENLNVSDKPVKMIINGQLFILLGEKMYDAKGQLVK